MPRRFRVEICGYHHVYNRGVAKGDIFRDDFDKEKFLKIVAEVSKTHKFNIHSFCLMSNHYHLLIENLRENLSSGMRHINSQYAIYFNKKYERVGHLWQDRFKSWYIADDTYLFTLFKYIELNPLKAGITKKVGEYKYASTYSFLKGAIPRFLQNSFVLREYNIAELFRVLDLGLSEKELKEVEKLHKSKLKKLASNEVVYQKPLKDFFVDIESKESRNRAIKKAFEEGYSKSEIAKIVGLSGAGVAKILKKFRV